MRVDTLESGPRMSQVFDCSGQFDKISSETAGLPKPNNLTASRWEGANHIGASRHDPTDIIELPLIYKSWDISVFTLYHFQFGMGFTTTTTNDSGGNLPPQPRVGLVVNFTNSGKVAKNAHDEATLSGRLFIIAHHAEAGMGDNAFFRCKEIMGKRHRGITSHIGLWETLPALEYPTIPSRIWLWANDGFYHYISFVVVTKYVSTIATMLIQLLYPNQLWKGYKIRQMLAMAILLIFPHSHVQNLGAKKGGQKQRTFLGFDKANALSSCKGVNGEGLYNTSIAKGIVKMASIYERYVFWNMAWLYLATWRVK